MRGEIIDSRIVPGVLIRLSQRIRFIPHNISTDPLFDIEETTVPVWKLDPLDGRASHYERVPSGSLATVIKRYVEREVTKFEVFVSGNVYHCYGTHADLVV